MDEVPNNNLHADEGTHPLQRIPIEICVTVGKAKPLVQDLINLTENAVLPLDRKVDDPVELYIGDRLIARGVPQEFVVIANDRLASINAAWDRVEAMRKATPTPETVAVT